MNLLEMQQQQQQQQLVDQRRGRYVRVSDTDRRQLIEAYKKSEDFIALAKKLNIKRSTARSILRTYIDEGRVSAKQRAGTRLRFITEEEAEMIREMKRRHPLITIGQIQMRLQRTSTRVLSKASISRILTNSIRLGKRAKRAGEGDDGHDDLNDTMITDHNEFAQLSSDEGTGEGIYIDEDLDDDEEEEDEDEDNNLDVRMINNNASSQNLDDFQRFMLCKTSVNEDESNDQEGVSWNGKGHYDENVYPTYESENEDELSEVDDNATKLNIDQSPIAPSSQSISNENLANVNNTDKWASIKFEPVCVFVNHELDSSDSEQQTTIDDAPTKTILNAQSTANRRVKICPICGEQNFSRLSHHLTVTHNLNREESLTLLAYADRTNNNTNTNNSNLSSIPTVSSSSPKDLDKSPQQTPISINTNNQQIPSSGFSPIATDLDDNNHPQSILTTSSSPSEQQGLNSLPIDGKKRLLCPRCNTWVLNLTDHLIKKHHLVSKQDRLPFLRLARNRSSTSNSEKPSSNHCFLINSNEQQTTPLSNNKKYQSIIKKYRKKIFNSIPVSSSSIPNRETSSTNSNSHLPKQIPSSRNMNISKDIATHQKFEQRLSVFRQQFAVTVAMQNSLMQQMELLQRSFVSIEEEWNDMKKEIVESIS